MKRCFLRIGDETEEYEIDATGYGSIASGTECRARRTWKYADKTWLRVLIGGKVDHIGGAQNAGGAVYEATVLGREPGKKLKDRTEGLFGA